MAKEISKSLIIGVGGTGQDIIIALKKRMHERFGEVPKNIIEFLSIDADSINQKDEKFNYSYNSKSLSKIIEFEEHERVYFGEQNLLSQLEGGRYRGFIPKNIRDIVPHISSGKGAAGKRILGKMLLASSYEDIKEKIIKVKLKRLLEKKSTDYNIIDEKIKIFLVGSFAGGAGSSMFIEVSNIIKSYKSENQNNNIDLIGFFSMPEFYMQYPSNEFFLANAYACFLEIDHIQETNLPNTKIVPDYENRVIGEPRFDIIYIMQNILSNKTEINKDTMVNATASAISNIVSPIGEKGSSVFVNSNQSSFVMGGKKRNYSSFGICDIILKRQELKNYIIKKIILNALNEYNIGDFKEEEFDKIRDNFIDTYNLDEGIGSEAKNVNKLIDSIFTINNSELNIVFNNVSVSDTVIEDLKESLNTFKQDINRKAASLLIAYDDTILADSKGSNGLETKGIISALNDLLKRLLYSNGGLSRTRLFSGSMVSQIKKMRLELNQEINDHQEEIEIIEKEKLESIYTEIRESQKSKNIFNTSRKNREIKNLIESYAYLVSNPHDKNSLRTHYLEIIRKQKAIEVYKKITSVLQEYYSQEGNESSGKITVFENDILQAINDLGLDIRHFKKANDKAFENINIKINYFFIKVLENESIYQEIVKNNPISVAEYISKNSNTNNLIEDLENYLLENIDKSDTILSRLNNPDFTIDDLITDYKDVIIKIGSEQLGYRDIKLNDYLMREVNNNLPIMWNYEGMNLKHDGNEIVKPEIGIIVGNHDGSEKFISYEFMSKLKGLPKSIQKDSYAVVPTNNPDIITIFVQEYAVPAWKLIGMRKYKESYLNANKLNTTYFHTDIRFEKNAADIFPQKNTEKTLHYWVVGFITGLIFNKKSGYYVKSRSGSSGTDVKCFDDTNPRGKNDRILAFEYFSESEDFSKEIKDKYERMLDRDKEKIRKQLLDFLHHKRYERNIIGKFKKSLSEEEEELLFREAKMIIQIGLEDLNMHSKDFINLDLNGQELEDHKQYLYDLGAEEVF